MKKNTFRQPRNASAEADKWVMGGSTTEPTPAVESASSGKQARLTIDLPEDLHSQFKAACAHHRTKMKAEVLKFIEEWTRKNRNTEK